MSLLSKLTLVIPTYNRQRYALRNMRYWSGSVVTVHVLDGSEQPIPVEDLAGLGANVNYHHLPISLYDRFGKAIDLVQTEYAVMLGDDEFFLPDALEACIRELEADETLVACMGRTLGFQSSSNRILARPIYTSWANYAVPQDDPIARMIHHMSSLKTSIIYSVVRTPVWKLALAIVVQNKKFPVYALVEYEFELAVSHEGKSKVIQNLMWLRSSENNPTGDGHPVDFQEWWVDKDKSGDPEEFLTLTASALTHGDIGRLEAVREGVRAAFNALIKSADATKGTRSRRAARSAARSAVTTRLPSAVKAPIKKILAVLPSMNRKSFLQAAKDLESAGVWVNFEQLSEIAEIVRQFHATPTD